MVIMVHDVSPHEVSGAQAILKRGLPQPQPKLIPFNFFFFNAWGIRFICILDKYANQKSS